MDTTSKILMPEDRPATFAMLKYDEEFGAIIRGLLETVLRRDSTLSVGERELIAALVAGSINCKFEADLHRELAVRHGFENFNTAYLSQIKYNLEPKLKALAEVGEDVVKRYGFSLDRSIIGAKMAGATEKEIFDAMTIGCTIQLVCNMVVGLNLDSGYDRELHEMAADFIIKNGYLYESVEVEQD
jgi:AhpD family alkylhydroperoxidase